MNERMHSDGRRVSGDHYHHDTHPSIHSPIQEDVDRNHPQPSDSRRKVPREIDKMVGTYVYIILYLFELLYRISENMKKIQSRQLCTRQSFLLDNVLSLHFKNEFVEE